MGLTNLTFEKKKLLLLMNLWLAIAAGALAVLGWLHLLSSQIVLVSVFLIAVGFAFESPAWTSIIPETVSTSELPSAATLGGLQLNISGILGPALGGLLLPFIGASSVFAVNAACFLAVLFAILQWKRADCEHSHLSARQRYLRALMSDLRHVQRAPKHFPTRGGVTLTFRTV